MSLPKTISLPDPALVTDLKGPLRNYLVNLNHAIRTLVTVITDHLSANRAGGTLVVDNGTTRVTVVITQGSITSVATGASTGATITWS
jgi:hypothetical protein